MKVLLIPLAFLLLFLAAGVGLKAHERLDYDPVTKFYLRSKTYAPTFDSKLLDKRMDDFDAWLKSLRR